MKKYLFKYSALLSILVCFIFSGCGKTDNYDWNSIDPGTQNITGPTVVKGNNIDKYNFLARPRGGSKFEWTVLSGPVVVNPNPVNGFIGVVTANSNTDTDAKIQVTETTNGGKTAVSNYTFHVISFCTFNSSQLIGDGKFTCQDKNSIGVATYDANFKILPGDTLLNDNFFYMGWKVKYYLSKDVNEEITMVKSQFEYNGDVVEVSGKGNYNTCNSSFSVNYAVTSLAGDTIENGWGIENFKKKN